MTKDRFADGPYLDGEYFYRSFRNEPVSVVAGKVVGSPMLAEPWTPLGTLDVKTDTLSEGEVTGTLTFGPGVILKVSGRSLLPADGKPGSVELIGEGLGA